MMWEIYFIHIFRIENYFLSGRLREIDFCCCWELKTNNRSNENKFPFHWESFFNVHCHAEYTNWILSIELMCFSYKQRKTHFLQKNIHCLLLMLLLLLTISIFILILYSLSISYYFSTISLSLSAVDCWWR